MKNIQDNKNKATLLQQHLESVGIKVPRSAALNVVAKLEGYRSHTVAKRGTPHAREQLNAGVVLYSGSYLHPDVQASYVANHGQHCPYCGSHKVNDAMDAYADIGSWDIRKDCSDCKKSWFSVYKLERIDGSNVPPTALQFILDGHQDCALCGGVGVEYSTFVPGRQGYQIAQCHNCHEACIHIYRLADLAEALDEEVEASDSPRYIISTGWGHLFGPGMAESITRFVFDTDRHAISHMQLLVPHNGTWVDANLAQMRDVQDSLTGANADALDDPEGWDLLTSNKLPAWVVDSTSN